mgnify:CR=1 FL=1
MTSHAGGNDEQSGISWYIYDTRADAVRKIIKPLLFLGWDGWGLNTASLFQMGNNVNPYPEIPCKGAGV